MKSMMPKLIALSIPSMQTETEDFALAIEPANKINPQDMYALVNKHTGNIELRGYSSWLMVCAMQTNQQALNKTRTGELNGYFTAPTVNPTVGPEGLIST